MAHALSLVRADAITARLQRGEELGDGAVARHDGVGRELGERLEREAPLVQARMRHRQPRLVDDPVAVEEQVEVDRPRAPALGRSRTPAELRARRRAGPRAASRGASAVSSATAPFRNARLLDGTPRAPSRASARRATTSIPVDLAEQLDARGGSSPPGRRGSRRADVRPHARDVALNDRLTSVFSRAPHPVSTACVTSRDPLAPVSHRSLLALPRAWRSCSPGRRRGDRPATGPATLVQLTAAASCTEAATLAAAGARSSTRSSASGGCTAAAPHARSRAFAHRGAVAFAQPERTYGVAATHRDARTRSQADEWWRAADRRRRPDTAGAGRARHDRRLRASTSRTPSSPGARTPSAQRAGAARLGGEHGTVGRVGHRGARSTASASSASTRGAVLRSWDAAQGAGHAARVERDLGRHPRCARARAASVINLSLGGHARPLDRARASARRSRAGSLVVAASGNDGDARQPARLSGRAPARDDGRRHRPLGRGRRLLEPFALRRPRGARRRHHRRERARQGLAVGPARASRRRSSPARPPGSGRCVRSSTRPGRRGHAPLRARPRRPGPRPRSGLRDAQRRRPRSPSPAPIRDPFEPNDDVDEVDPNGDRYLSRPRRSRRRRARPRGSPARLDAYEDPRDVFRVWLPARTPRHRDAHGVGPNGDLALWSAGRATSVSGRFATGTGSLARRAKGTTERLRTGTPGRGPLGLPRREAAGRHARRDLPTLARLVRARTSGASGAAARRPRPRGRPGRASTTSGFRTRTRTRATGNRASSASAIAAANASSRVRLRVRDLVDGRDDVAVVDGVLDPVGRRRRRVGEVELEVDEEALTVAPLLLEHAVEAVQLDAAELDRHGRPLPARPPPQLPAPRRAARTSWTRNSVAPRSNAATAAPTEAASVPTPRLGSPSDPRERALPREPDEHRAAERDDPRRARAAARGSGRASCRSRCPGRGRSAPRGCPAATASASRSSRNAATSETTSSYRGASCIVRGSPCMCIRQRYDARVGDDARELRVARAGR